jgi:hypothetical protein
MAKQYDSSDNPNKSHPNEILNLGSPKIINNMETTNIITRKINLSSIICETTIEEIISIQQINPRNSIN